MLIFVSVFFYLTLQIFQPIAELLYGDVLCTSHPYCSFRSKWKLSKKMGKWL